MTQPELARLTKLWQKRLRLQDWVITPTIEPMDALPDAYGQSPYDDAEMSAAVRIREDAGEDTLVHELLHLRLAPFSDGDPSEPNHEARETAINLLADCYLKAYARHKR